MRRLLVRAVAGVLVATAALAIAVLLFGDFGETEGKVLATTGLLAVFGLVALPAAVLFDQGRLAALAVANVVVAAAALVLSIVGIWAEPASDAFGRTLGSAWIVAVALTQTAALASQRRWTAATRRLFAASVVLASVAAAFALGLVWTDSAGWPARILGAVVVADALAVALQPLLARSAAPAPGLRRVTIEGPDAAVEAAVRAAESAGGRVVAGGNAPCDVEH